MEKEDYDILRLNIEQAAKEAALKKDDETEAIIFPFWMKTIHEILKRRGKCPCQNEQPEKCFLKLEEKIQKKIMAKKDDLSFKKFFGFYKEAKRLYFS